MKVIVNENEAFDTLKCESPKEWLGNRLIGGSSASIILNCNPYSTKRKLYDQLVAPLEQRSSESTQTEATEYGHKAEAPLRTLFALDHKDIYDTINPDDEKPEIYRSKKYPFMTATLDGTLIEKATGRKGIYEGKTARINNPSQKLNWENKIPQNYYCQILHYLAVTGYDFVELHAQLEFDKKLADGTTNKFFTRKTYHFERKECLDDINYLVQEEVKFYEDYLKKGVRPNDSIVFDL